MQGEGQCGQEMSLAQWMGTLPDSHRANKEFRALSAELEAMTTPEKRIAVAQLLAKLKTADEPPGDTILRALTALDEISK